MSKYHDRPAADIAFCVAALASCMPESTIAGTLDAEYLPQDPNPVRKAAYIKRTLGIAGAWI